MAHGSIRLVALALLVALPAAAEGPAGRTPDQEDLIREVRELRTLERASGAGVILLDEISRALPELAWLKEMTFRDGEVWLSGKAFNTAAIARFVESLGRVQGFAEPALIEATETLDKSFSFQLSFKVVPAPPEEDTPEAVRKLEQEKIQLRRRLARPEDVPALVGKLRALMKQSDLEIASFVEARPGRDGGVPVDVEVTGATYHGLSMFFDRLRRFSAFTRLDALTIRQVETSQRAAGSTITASFRLVIPRSTPLAGEAMILQPLTSGIAGNSPTG
jgi:hypothetical protein